MRARATSFGIAALVVALGMVLLASALLVGPARLSAQTSEDQGVLAGFVSRLLSTPSSQVSIGTVEGALSSDATIRNVTVADAAGVYLSVDRIRLVWRRAALLQRRIEIQQLEIGRVTLSRRPNPVAGEPEPGPILPELPLSLQVGAFRLGELVLSEPVLGTAARIGAEGSASLGAAEQGLRATLALRRLDAPGTADLVLAFVPQGERLDLTLRHDEPSGGLLARLAGIPGTPPVKLDVTGAGTLDDWIARLAFEAGPETSAEGQARLAREGSERRLGLDLSSRISALLPPLVAPIFAGTTGLNANLGFADGGAITIRSLRLTSTLAQLDIAGTLSAERVLDVAARARAVPNTGTVARIRESQLERLAFDGSVSGPLAAPRISGALDLAGLATPDLSLSALTARFAATPLAPPRGQAPSMAAGFRLEADASARGIATADEGLTRALGGDATLTLRGDIDEAGVARLELARLASPTLALGFTGRVGRTVLDGQIGGEVLRLDALSELAGQALAGRLRLDARLSGNPSRPEVTAELNGATTALRLGDQTLNRLLGERVMLAGRARLAQGRLSLNALTLTGSALAATLDGQLSANDVALDARLGLSDLALLDQRLGGRAEVTARATGPTSDPNVTLRITVPDARALGRPVRGLALDVAATRPVTAPDLALSGRGSIDAKPLTLDARLTGTEADAAGARSWSVPRLEAALGSARLQGDGQIGANGFATGMVSFAADNLDDISALVLRKLSGRVSARIVAEARERRQDLAIQAEGERIAVDAVRIAALSANLALNDARSRPSLRGTARLDGLEAAGERFETLALEASDAGQGASAVTLTGRARGFDLSGAGRIEPGDETVIRLERLRAVRNGRVLALIAPAVLRLTAAGARTEQVAIDVSGGRLTLAGLVGRELDATIVARVLPLAAAELFTPGLGLAGTLDGEARLMGQASAPRGSFTAAVRGFALPALREAGLPALEVRSEGRLTGAAAVLTGSVRGGRAIDLALNGTIPFAERGALDLSARGTLDAALANARLAGAGQRLTGRVAIDGRITGSRAVPQIQGSTTLSGGSFSDAVQGIALSGIEGRVTGRGDTVAIERLSARTEGGGTLAVTGRVEADPARGFPVDLRITGRRARLIDSGLARLVANLDLSVSGPATTAPRLAGRVDVIDLDVRVPERLGGARAPLTDARHLAPPPQTRARLAQIARAQGNRRSGGAAPFRAALDLIVDAPGRIFVRGRGLDAELGGSVRIGGTTLAPLVNGAFDLRRGRLSILTQRLDFTRGRLTFAGAGLVPELDFLAETRAGDVTARVAVTGPADQPSFAFTSSPGLPEDEVLSRLLFARAAGGLSPFQAIQLAQAAAQLAGTGGPDLFETTRRALGVDDLDIGVGNGGPTIGISRAISDRIRLGIRAGARPESTGVGVDIDLTRRLRLQSEVGADGRAAVGVGIEQEY